MAVHVLVHALELPDGSRQDDVAQLGGRLVQMPLEAPVELGCSHAREALVHVGMVVAVVVLKDNHLDVRQRALVVRRTDAMAELGLAHAAFPITLLAGENLGEAVVVEEHRHLVIARIAMPISTRRGNTARRGQACARLAAASARDVTCHGLEQHGSRSRIVAHVTLCAGVEVLQMDRLGSAVQTRELPNGFGRHRADGGGPLRRLLDAVGALAHAVSAPFLEAGLVDPFVHELVVDQVLLVEHLGDCEHHGKVGAGADGNPLIGKDLCRLRIARIDDDRLAAVLVSELHIVGRRAEPRDNRVHSPHDEEFGIEDVGRLETRKRLRKPLRGLGEVDAQMQHLACGMARR